jgi:hypothetical protein
VKEPDLIAEYRRNYTEKNWVVLPQVLDSSLLNRILFEMGKEQFHSFTHAGLGPNKELCLARGLTTSLIELALNSETVFDQVNAITGCGPIGSITGRVYRFEPDSDHSDSWHGDNALDRHVALSINLTERCYSGGVLEIRKRSTEDAVEAVIHPEFGDAILGFAANHIFLSYFILVCRQSIRVWPLDC